jgi:hypothetical protein
MVSAPVIVEEVITRAARPGGDGGCAARLLFAFEARSFHCVHSVFSGLDGIVPECPRMHNMTYPLACGIAFSGGTCAAAAAGVLAIGLATGTIEDSYLRVISMMIRMLTGGDMMADHVNNFNPAINRGQQLMEWFENEQRSLDCADLTGIDIGDPGSITRYLSGDGITRCEAIAEAVAVKVRAITQGRV